MAISVGHTIKELDKMASDLGLEVIGTGKDGKKKKEDYIKPIREHNLNQRYGSIDKIPDDMKLMLEMKSPMLAGRIDNLKQEQKDEIWNDESWVLEQKLNGVRCRIVNTGNGIHLYSRHNSDVDLLPIEFTDKILFPDNCDLSKISKSFILDTEMESDNPNICTIMGSNGVVTNSQLQAVTSLISSTPQRAKVIQRNNNLRLVFNSFDCLYYDGQWIMDYPLRERRKLAEEIVTALENCGFNIRRVRVSSDNSYEGKKKFYNDIITHGGEGAVAKRLDGIYIPDTTRNFNGWIKLKKSAMDMLMGAETNLDELFGDTIDAFITGYEPGTKGSALENYVGAVCVSVNVVKSNGESYIHEIGRFSGIDMALREDMTEIVNGEPILKPSYYNRVVEVDGLGLSSRALRLNHCTFQGFRYDKLPDSCIIPEEQLYSMINQ